MHKKLITLGSLALSLTLALSACGSGSGSADGNEDKTIKVMYQRTEGVQTMDHLFNAAKEQFEKENDGVTIKLEPIEAAEDDYATQLALSQQSPDTAPDVFYQDTFRVRSDVAAGYLLPLDNYLEQWDDWGNFIDAAKEAGRDGDKTYAIPLGTDTRGIWYNKNVFEKAGIATPWQPKDWQDILDAAEKIKSSDPDVVPFHMYAGKPAGEGTAMQSFLMLLYGTGDGKGLYDEDSSKWIVGSKGFVDSLQFLKDLYDGGYSVPAKEALDANLWQTVFDTRFPENKLGGIVEGSYGASFWAEQGPYPWAEFKDNIEVTGFPTQEGQGPGYVSMSGGWTVAIGANTKHPDEAFKFLTYVFNFENNRDHVVEAAKIAVRKDVAKDPKYLESDPYVEFFTKAVEFSHYRPATADYPRISAELQSATEKVVTDAATPEEAAKAYDEALKGIVGADNVTEG
uniref:extracellular solute-binding protein n=1 Tax=Tessaracoccus timonensis TaxID=2161816 RepID=UPI000D55B7B1|nr:extracellular solute-binding protein [Tessaracoccus timonensis]